MNVAFYEPIPGYYSIDGIHPIVEGMQKFAKMVVHGFDYLFEPERFAKYKDEKYDIVEDLDYAQYCKMLNEDVQIRYEQTKPYSYLT